MNRRKFLGLSGVLAMVPFLKPRAAQAASAPVSSAPRGSFYARPQKTVDDLIAEYKAWADGDLDDHDMAVLDYRWNCTGRTPHRDPSLSYGRCSCVSTMPAQVQAHLDREIAAERGRLDEHRQRMRFLLRCSQRWEQRGAPASRYAGSLPKWMTE